MRHASDSYSRETEKHPKKVTSDDEGDAVGQACTLGNEAPKASLLPEEPELSGPAASSPGPEKSLCCAVLPPAIDGDKALDGVMPGENSGHKQVRSQFADAYGLFTRLILLGYGRCATTA